MKYPAHLYTIVLDMGPNLAPFQQHHADRQRAMRVYHLLKDKATRSRGVIENLQMWHQNSLVSSFTPNPPTAAWLPPADPNGVRHIPEGVSYNVTCIANYQRFGKPADMAGKVPKAPKGPKKLPEGRGAPPLPPGFILDI